MLRAWQPELAKNWSSRFFSLKPRCIQGTGSLSPTNYLMYFRDIDAPSTENIATPLRFLFCLPLLCFCTLINAWIWVFSHLYQAMNVFWSIIITEFGWSCVITVTLHIHQSINCVTSDRSKNLQIVLFLLITHTTDLFC